MLHCPTCPVYCYLYSVSVVLFLRRINMNELMNDYCSFVTLLVKCHLIAEYCSVLRLHSSCLSVCIC